MRRPIIFGLRLSLGLVLSCALPAAAQQVQSGVYRALKPRVTQNSSYNLVFSDTPLKTTSVEACYYNCFFNGGTCNYSGTVQFVKGVAAPFGVTNLRVAQFGDCGGTPTTLPVNLQAGQWLLQDFTFTPTALGTFQDTLVYNLTATGSLTEVFTWFLSGSTTAPPPVIASFAATPSTIRPGQPATLSWVTQGSSSVLIDNGVGSQPASGTATVTPSATTTYTLTAMSGALSSTATATVTVITTPTIVVSSFPGAMLQPQGLAGGTTTYTLTNAGGAPAAITLSQSGTFFSQSPTSFTLNPGSTQTITITASPQAAGEFEGTSIPSGSGVTTGLSVPIKLLSAAPPSGTVFASPATNRVDVAAPPGTSPSGTVSFTNNGTSALTGVLISSVPWIIPQSGVITIPAGSTVALSFTIDRSKRVDAGAPIGSVSGNLSLVYLSGASGKNGTLATTPPSVSLVTVVDTAQLSVSNASPPALAAGEIALFVAGAGHVTGTVGTFISDVSVLSPPGNPTINDIRFFFTPTALGSPQKTAQVPPVGGLGVSLADVVNNVFGSNSQVGSLQIRSASAAKLSVATAVFNASNPAGTYGTTIPTFRSDRAVPAGGRLVLTGLRQDTTGHTNLFIQETAGVGVTVQTQFLDVNGTTLGTRSDTVGAFALSQINNVVPTGAVVAILTNTSSGNGQFLAYATPVDQASGDNWSIVDWSRQYGYAGSDPVIIPVAGILQGANNTFFRTDVAITNTATGQASGTLRFYPRGGSPTDRQVTLGSLQTSLLTNVIGSLFGAPSGSVGYLLFTPAAGTFAITSRTYTTVAGQVATFGTHVPTLAAAASLTTGSLRAIGSLQDSATSTVVAARPATFRTNFGLMETSGNSATVRVTLRFNYPAGTLVQALGSASADFSLAPYQFMQLNGLASQILGASRDALGDLTGLEVDFQVISGNGAIAVYTSSTDNGTGDVILRTE
jgi:hypothetical protein